MEAYGIVTPYLVILLEVGHHDDGGAVHLPNHSPEVWKGGRDGTLCCYVSIALLVTLQDGHGT